MARTLILLAAIAGLLPASVVSARPNAATSFAAYPATPYREPVRAPAFRGPQRAYGAYRTKIRQSVRDGARFGGHYAVAVIGCGAGCRFGYLTDLRTGLVYELPHGGEEYVEISYRVRADSRLLKTQWVRMSKDYDRIGCAMEDFLWTGKAFRSLSRRSTADECVDQADVAPATD